MPRQLLALVLGMAGGAGSGAAASGLAPLQEGCAPQARDCLQLAAMAGTSDATLPAPGADGRPVGDGGPVVQAEPAPRTAAAGSLNFVFRNFLDAQTVDKVLTRHAWTQNMQAHYESAFTPGNVGWGIDVSPFATLVLKASRDAGNMVNVGADGVTQDRRLRAHLGRYTLKAKVGNMLVKYGLQQLSNPFLESKDNRGLPPTFKGISMTGHLLPQLLLEAGSVTAVLARGQDQLSALFTTYGATRIDRLSYLGGSWEYSADGNASLYFNQAKDVWNQAFFSLKDSAGDLQSLKWGGNLNAYRSREQGRQLQGKIDNTAYSVSLFAARRAVTVSLSYQKILGDQYFDYAGETWGIYLDNAMNVDYNAPHEQSMQLRGVIDGAALNYPGFKLMLWALAGWGADATAESGKHASPASPLHILYWKGGHIARGSHREIGINPSFTVQTGRFKDSKISLIATLHKSSPYYPDDGNREFKLMVDIPLKAF